MIRPRHLVTQGLLLVVVCVATTPGIFAQTMRSLPMKAETLTFDLPWNDPIVTVHELKAGNDGLFISKHGAIWRWRNGFPSATYVTALQTEAIKDAALVHNDLFVAVHGASIAGYPYPAGGAALFSIPIDSVLYVEKDDPALFVIHTRSGLVGFDTEKLAIAPIPYLPATYVKASHGKGLTVWSDEFNTVYRDTGSGPEIVRQYEHVVDLSVCGGDIAVLSQFGDPADSAHVVEIYVSNGGLRQQFIAGDLLYDPQRIILRVNTFAIVTRSARFGDWCLHLWPIDHPLAGWPYGIYVPRSPHVVTEVTPDPYELDWFRLTNRYYLYTRGPGGPQADAGASVFIGADKPSLYRGIYTASHHITPADARSLWVSSNVPRDVILQPDSIPELSIGRFDLPTRTFTWDDRWRLTGDHDVQDMYGYSGGVVVRCTNDSIYRMDASGTTLVFDMEVTDWRAFRRGLYIEIRSEFLTPTLRQYYSDDGFRTYRELYMIDGWRCLDDRIYQTFGRSPFTWQFTIQNEEEVWRTYQPFRPFADLNEGNVVRGPFADWCCFTMVVSDSDRSSSQAWIYDLNSDPVKAFDVVHPDKGPVYASIRAPHLERYVGQWAADGEVGWLLTDGQVWEFSDATAESYADSIVMVSDYQLVKIIAPNQHRLITFFPQVTSVAEDTPVQSPAEHTAIRAYDSYVWQHDLVNAEVTIWDVNGRERTGAVLESSDGTSRVQIGDRGLFLLRASTGRSTRTQVLMVY